MALKRIHGSGNSSSSPKKQKSSFDVAKVVRALDDYSNLPSSATEMLCSAFPFAATAPDQPHEFKTSILKMVDSTLKSVAEDLQTAAEKAKAFAEQSGDKERVEKQFVDAARFVAVAKTAVANKEADFTEAQLYHQRTSGLEKSIRTKHSMENAEYEMLCEQKKILQDLDERVAMIKTQAIDKAAAKKIDRDLRSQGLNASLLNTFSGVVARPVAERTSFDDLTMNNLVDELAILHKNIQTKLDEQSGPQETRKIAFEKAHHDADEAKSAMNAASASLRDRQHELKDAESKLEDLKNNLDHFAKHLKDAQAEASAAEDELVDFQTSVLKPFREWLEQQDAHASR